MRPFGRTTQPPAPNGSQYRSTLAMEASGADGGAERPLVVGSATTVMTSFLDLVTASSLRLLQPVVASTRDERPWNARTSTAMTVSSVFVMANTLRLCRFQVE